MSVGMKLKALRNARKKTQKQAAADLNITKSALAMYERDERVPRDEVKIRIANYYEEPVESFFLVSKSTNSAHNKLDRGGEAVVKIAIEGEAEEIAALVPKLRERPKKVKIRFDGAAITRSALEAIRGMHEGTE